MIDQLNVSHQAVSKWERGESSPDVGTLPKLASILGVSVDSILKGEKVIYNRVIGGTEGDIIKEISEGNADKVANMLKNEEIKLDSVINIAPMLKTSTMDKIASGISQTTLSMDHVIELAPFVGQDVLDSLVEKVE